MALPMYRREDMVVIAVTEDKESLDVSGVRKQFVAFDIKEVGTKWSHAKKKPIKFWLNLKERPQIFCPNPDLSGEHWKNFTRVSPMPK